MINGEFGVEGVNNNEKRLLDMWRGKSMRAEIGT